MKHLGINENPEFDKKSNDILDNNLDVAYKYSLGGDYKVSKEWEPLGLVDYYSSFGPELSFGSFLDKKDRTS